jgi:hypothetical protein
VRKKFLGCKHFFKSTCVFLGPKKVYLKNALLKIFFQSQVGCLQIFLESLVVVLPNLEPKLVSALSETKCLFQLFRFYTETESFDVSIEPKQTEDQPKQFDREHILFFFTGNLGFSRFFSFFLVYLVFSVCFETVCFGCFASIPKQRVSIEPKQTEDPPKQFKREYIWEFFRTFRVVSVCFSLLRNRSVCFGCFYIGSKQTKQTRNRSCFGLFWFNPKFIFVCFEDTLVSVAERNCKLCVLTK